MCGRYGVGMSRGELAECLPGVELPGDGIEPRWNVAPTQPVLVLRAVGEQTRGERVRWGIEMVTPQGRARTLINVRAETLLDRENGPSERGIVGVRRVQVGAFPRSGEGGRERVLVPATHFFEWRRGRPMLIAPRDRLMAFAGLLAAGTDGGWEVAIVTCPPNRVLADIHDRMPVVVDRASWARWLDRRIPLHGVADLLRACREDELRVSPASRLVNDVANDTSAVLAPSASEPVQGELPF